MTGVGARMPTGWTSEELQQLGAARELQVTTGRPDGTWRPWVPIWVVCVDTRAYVRTWYRRDTGWYGHALAQRRARIRVPELEAEVTVEDFGEGTGAQRAGIDAAYRVKSGRFGTGRMVSAAAAAATLRLTKAT